MTKAFAAYVRKTSGPFYHGEVEKQENIYATASILLVAVELESYRNVIFWLTGQRIDRYDVPANLCATLTNYHADLPSTRLNQALQEIFVLRDIIAHSHIWAARIQSEPLSSVVRLSKPSFELLVPDYGNKKYNKCIDSKNSRTRMLKLHAQPMAVGFEDLFKVLLVTDTLVALLSKFRETGLLPTRDVCQLRQNEKYDSGFLSQYLTDFYNQIEQVSQQQFTEKVHLMSGQRLIKEVKLISKQLRKDLGECIPPYEQQNWFITNQCPKCSELGFKKRHGLSDITYCFNCRYVAPE